LHGASIFSRKTVALAEPHADLHIRKICDGWLNENDVKNPCIDVCKFDKKTGWCIGCGRSKDECRAWKKASKKRRKEIKHNLPHRLEKLKEHGKTP
jgi:predicted Fe-S protein YdhL (DUF1289 family)